MRILLSDLLDDLQRAFLFLLTSHLKNLRFRRVKCLVSCDNTNSTGHRRSFVTICSFLCKHDFRIAYICYINNILDWSSVGTSAIAGWSSTLIFNEKNVSLCKENRVCHYTPLSQQYTRFNSRFQALLCLWLFDWKGSGVVVFYNNRCHVIKREVTRAAHVWLKTHVDEDLLGDDLI